LSNIGDAGVGGAEEVISNYTGIAVVLLLESLKLDLQLWLELELVADGD
jgi:hypothetical protein